MADDELSYGQLKRRRNRLREEYRKWEEKIKRRDEMRREIRELRMKINQWERELMRKAQKKIGSGGEQPSKRQHIQNEKGNKDQTTGEGETSFKKKKKKRKELT